MKKDPNCLYRHDGRQWHKAESAICQYCGLEFIAMIKEIRKGGGKFCSRICQRTHQAAVNAEANRTVGLTAGERKKQWLAKVSPLVVIAHKAVQSAVDAGLLVRAPCEKCGNTTVDGHHDDYLKPLEVRWLCRAHHLEVHRSSENWKLKEV